MQLKQPMQLRPNHQTPGVFCWLSGFWHQRQRKGQPLRKTVVRMPGPSWVELREMSKTRASGSESKACISQVAL